MATRQSYDVAIWGVPTSWLFPWIIHFNRMFHQINHPAIGVPPRLWKPPYVNRDWTSRTCWVGSLSNLPRQHPEVQATSKIACVRKTTTVSFACMFRWQIIMYNAYIYIMCRYTYIEVYIYIHENIWNHLNHLQSVHVQWAQWVEQTLTLENNSRWR